MATAELLSAVQTSLLTTEQYLRSTFRPDRDLVDGRTEGRNLGEYEHSKVQAMLLRIFAEHEREWKTDVLPECRLQVKPNRFRVSDLMVLRAGEKVDRFVTSPPFICIEILSPEDSFHRIAERVADYLAMGVEHVWVFDPAQRSVYRCSDRGFNRILEDSITITGTPVCISRQQVFASLEDRKAAPPVSDQEKSI